ncbi:hypothetical protein ACJX0J_009742, partial [Zea mays]
MTSILLEIPKKNLRFFLLTHHVTLGLSVVNLNVWVFFSFDENIKNLNSEIPLHLPWIHSLPLRVVQFVLNSDVFIHILALCFLLLYVAWHCYVQPILILQYYNLEVIIQ